MKYIPVFIAFALLTISLVNCKKDDPSPLTDQQQAAKKLSVSWGSTQVLSAPVAGSDGTLENLVLTFTATKDFEPATFTSTGAPEIFLTNTASKWLWESTNSTTRILLSNVSPVQEFTIEELSETTLTISFAFDGPLGGRTTGVGEYQLKLTRL